MKKEWDNSVGQNIIMEEKLMKLEIYKVIIL